MCIPVHSPQLPGYIDVTQTILIILTLGGLCISSLCNCGFGWEGVVHHEYAPPGQTINKKYGLNVLCWLRDAI